MPPYTQTLGVLLPPASGKYGEQLARVHKLMEALIQELPAFDFCRIRLHPEIRNWLPFYWHGFQQYTRYTYLLPDISNLDEIWDNMRSHIRREIRKAKKQVEIIERDEIDLLVELQNKTFQRQNLKTGKRAKTIRRIWHSCRERRQGQLFFAQDAAQRFHAGLLLVWDDRTAYYLIGGTDPALRTSGAHSLLLWKAIQYASSKGLQVFNFEGSMIRSIERFFRGFGAIQTPYFEIWKYDSRLLKMLDCIGRRS